MNLAVGIYQKFFHKTSKKLAGYLIPCALIICPEKYVEDKRNEIGNVIMINYKAAGKLLKVGNRQTLLASICQQRVEELDLFKQRLR